MGYEDDQDPVCVKSRTGYVLTLGDCPFLWVSKLQTEIALSTLESEYIALSTSMRDLLPIRRLVDEMRMNMDEEVGNSISITSKVFEDNNGEIVLSESSRLTPRSKHIGVKYHWFREHIKDGSGIKIEKIETSKQKVDIFTKGLNEEKFTLIRKILMGW